VVHDGKPLVAYKYAPSPFATAASFTSASTNADDSPRCRCADPQFTPNINAHHGHILTKDMGITELLSGSQPLRQIQEKGTKFRAAPPNCSTYPIRTPVQTSSKAVSST